jgi:toxin ParE1/3/4
VPEFRLSPAAQKDVDAIFDYTADRWGPDQAESYLARIMILCGELATAPHRAPECAHIRDGYRRQIAAEHVIYFKPTPYGIAVIRILHQRMDATRHL